MCNHLAEYCNIRLNLLKSKHVGVHRVAKRKDEKLNFSMHVSSAGKWSQNSDVMERMVKIPATCSRLPTIRHLRRINGEKASGNAHYHVDPRGNL